MTKYHRQLHDIANQKMDISGSEVISDTRSGFLLMGSGSDGTAQYLKINSDGELVTTITDVLTVTASVDVTGNVEQGLAGTNAQAWFVRISDGSQVLGTGSSAPFYITGAVDTQVIGPLDSDGNIVVAISGVNNDAGSLLITGSVVLGEQPIELTGSVTVNSIASPVDVTQGDAGSEAQSWYVRVTDGTQVLGTGSSAPVFTSGSVHVQALPPVTGTVEITSIASPVDINGPVNQGDAGTQAEGWFTRISDGTQVLGTGSSAPIFTSGSVHVQNFPVTQSVEVVEQPIEVFFDQPIVVTGAVALLEEPVQVTGTVALEGGSVTVDGSVSVGNFPATQSIVHPLGPTATRTSFTASIVSTQVITENPDRKGIMFYVSSSGEDVACYLGFGAGPVSTSDASFILYSDDAYTLENTFITAEMNAVFNLHTGSVRLYVTEVD